MSMRTGVEIELESRIAELEAALNSINDIRNSIIGLQSINWSEHIYPLVEVLEKAGIVGMGYPFANKHFGTMLERTNAAEADVARLRAALEKAVCALEITADFVGDITNPDSGTVAGIRYDVTVARQALSALDPQKDQADG